MRLLPGVAGERGESGEVLAQEQGGRALPSGIMRRDDAPAGSTLRGHESLNRIGGKRGLIAKGEESGVEGAGELFERGDTCADRRGHAFRPRGVFGDEDGQAGESGADVPGACTEHDDHRPGPGGERGLGGAHDERATLDKQQLLRFTHAGRCSGG